MPMTIAAKDVRYIKLGRGGAWEKISLERGELHFGHSKIPHDLALTGDREQIRQLRIEQGRDPRAAAEDARETVDFYSVGSGLPLGHVRPRSPLVDICGAEGHVARRWERARVAGS